MFDIVTAVGFIEQSGLRETAGVLGNRFEVAIERPCYFFYRYALAFFNQLEYLDSPMIGDTLYVPLQLFGRFCFTR